MVSDQINALSERLSSRENFNDLQDSQLVLIMTRVQFVNNLLQNFNGVFSGCIAVILPRSDQFGGGLICCKALTINR
jgi:hypothetical protein